MPQLERSTEKITKQHLSDLYDFTMAKIREKVKRRSDDSKEDYDLLNPFAIALCQGAALHYLGENYFDETTGEMKKGVKDFDIWVFYKKKDNKKFTLNRDRSMRELPYESEDFGKKHVDIMMRAIDYEGTPIENIQNWLDKSKNSTPLCLRKKAVIMIYPHEHCGIAVWCKGKPYTQFSQK